MLQTITQIMKNKQRKMALSCSKKISAILRGITSKHHDDFYCLNYFQSFATEKILESHKKVCQNAF